MGLVCILFGQGLVCSYIKSRNCLMERRTGGGHFFFKVKCSQTLFPRLFSKGPLWALELTSGGLRPPESLSSYIFLTTLFQIMENRIYFISRGKSYEISETVSLGDLVWVGENARLYIRRMTLNSGALWWLWMKEASEVRRKTFKTWKVRDVSINIICSLKFNKSGRFLSIITTTSQSRAVIIIPENKPNEV